MNLNPDLFSVILDQIADCEPLYVLLSTLPSSHPYFHLTLHRRLRLGLVITCDVLPSKTHRLLDLLQMQSSRFIRKLDIYTTPSPTIYHEFQRNGIWTDLLAEEYAQIPKRLPEFFTRSTNLQEVSWQQCSEIPKDCFESLGKLERMKIAKIDCSSVNNQGGESWDIKPFLTSLGPQLTTLHLHKLDERAFTAFQSTAHLLTSLRSLELDITHGTWDWDNRGSPQLGASDHYVFKTLDGSYRLTSFKLISSDLTIRPPTGPLNLVNPACLRELHLEVVHCFGWTSIRRINAFQSQRLRVHDFISLVHLSITDQARNTLRLRWQNEFLRGRDERQAEIGRIYYGLLDFVSGLKRLKKLWVNERVLCVLDLDAYSQTEQDANLDQDEAWQSLYPFHSAQASMKSPAWVTLIESDVLWGLESFRVGLGPLNVESFGVLLGHVRRDRLVEFGFEWDWKEFGKDQPISPELISHLQSMTVLKDVHFTFPRPETVDQRVDEQTIHDVNAIFAACPSVCRVGVGRNCVWERRTFVIGADSGGFEEQIQLVDQEYVSEFYDVGFTRRALARESSVAQRDEMEHDVDKLIHVLERAS